MVAKIVGVMPLEGFTTKHRMPVLSSQSEPLMPYTHSTGISADQLRQQHTQCRCWEARFDVTDSLLSPGDIWD